MALVADAVRSGTRKALEKMEASATAKGEVDTVNLFCKIMKKAQTISEGS